MSNSNTDKLNNTYDERLTLLPEYLKDNDFIVELNYKLWVTKGSRFKAAERCERQNDRYTKIIAFVSAYMIIINVINLCKIPVLTLEDNYIATITIGFSIILLVASQFIYARNYSVQSNKFHCCALEISNVYNRLRIEKNQDEVDVNKLTLEYESILSRYDNHLPIDYEMFKTTKPKYFKLTKREIYWSKLQYFNSCNSLYYFSMIGVPLLYLFLALFINNYI